MITEKLNAEFEEILKEVVGPFFRKIGFRRKGYNFFHPSGDISQTFNVQKSQSNSSFDKLYFTFNFGFFNQDIYNISWDNETAIEFPTIAESFVKSQLGNYSHKRDHWYELSTRIDKQIVAASVRSDLEQDLRPLFNTHKSLGDLKDFIDKNEKIKSLISPYAYIAFLMQSNQREKGKMAIQTNYLKALSFTRATHTIQYPYSQSETKMLFPESKEEYLTNILRLAKRYDVAIEEKKPPVRKKSILE